MPPARKSPRGGLSVSASVVRFGVVMPKGAQVGGRLYAVVAVGGFRRYATYRVATAAGVFTNTVFGFIMAYTYTALWDAASAARRVRRLRRR